MSNQNEPRYQIRTARNEVLPAISLDELKKWVREGRVSPEGDRITQVGSGVWGKISDYPELGYNAAAARTEIDAQLAKTKRVRVALLLAFIIPASIAIGLFAMPSYDATQEIRIERQLASQARIDTIKAEGKMKLALTEAATAKKRQDESERLQKAAQEANERLKGDVANAVKIAETIKGGTEEQSKLLSALESQVRKAEAGASKARIDNLELRQKLARVEENAEVLSKEVLELKGALDAEHKKSIVQKIFDTR
jgi:hypothetical protein